MLVYGQSVLVYGQSVCNSTFECICLNNCTCRSILYVGELADLQYLVSQWPHYSSFFLLSYISFTFILFLNSLHSIFSPVCICRFLHICCVQFQNHHHAAYSFIFIHFVFFPLLHFLQLHVFQFLISLPHQENFSSNNGSPAGNV